MAKKVYGIIPKLPEEIAFIKIRGDAGIYKVWGLDHYNGKVLVDRACGVEWVSFEKCRALSESQADELRAKKATPESSSRKEGVVHQIIAPPALMGGLWFVRCRVEAEGALNVREILCTSEDEARRISVGSTVGI